MTTARITLAAHDTERLTDAWLDAAFAATREARIRRAVTSSEGRAARRRVMVLTGVDIAQLRSLLRLRATHTPDARGGLWSIELRNTRSRVATLQIVGARFVRVDEDGWAELRDVETLARWLDARGFRAPFEAWKSLRGCVRSPRG